jgi:hypothetical protein
MADITRCWHEWTIDGGERKIVLVLETSLELQPGEDDFDMERIEALVEEATRRMRSSASPIDSIRIVPAA